MGERLIELRDVTKSYGRVYALGGVNLHVDRGEVVGLIGDNGAGKSTLIKILAGVVKPTSRRDHRPRRAGDELERGAFARSRHRDGVPGPRARRPAVDRPQHLHGPRNRRPFRFSRDRARKFDEAGRLMREIGFTSKVFTPHSIVGQLSGGERQGVAIARAIYKQGGSDHPRRADDGAVADRDREGLPFRATGARQRPLDHLHRPQHPPRLRHRRPLRRARSRPGGAGDDESRDRVRRGTDRVHGGRGASRRAPSSFDPGARQMERRPTTATADRGADRRGIRTSGPLAAASSSTTAPALVRSRCSS